VHEGNFGTCRCSNLLPAKLRRPYIERMHADLGHFGRTKTCLALAHRAYFPGWHSLTGLVVRNCLTCNMHQRSHQKPRQANLKPMREFHPMPVIHADLVGPLPEGKNSRNQRVFNTYSLSLIPLLVTCGFCPFVTKQPNALQQRCLMR